MSLGRSPRDHRATTARRRRLQSHHEQAGHCAVRRHCVHLFGRGVRERDELVHLQEGVGRLRHLHAHPPAFGRVAIDVAVFDGLVEHGGQAIDELADRGRTKRLLTASARITDHRTCGDRGPELGGLPQLVRFERLTKRGVDLVEPVFAEERQQVAAEAPPVIVLRVGVDRPVTENAGDLGLEPC
jgi:hypothetical protein